MNWFSLYIFCYLFHSDSTTFICIVKHQFGVIRCSVQHEFKSAFRTNALSPYSLFFSVVAPDNTLPFNLSCDLILNTSIGIMLLKLLCAFLCFSLSSCSFESCPLITEILQLCHVACCYS